MTAPAAPQPPEGVPDALSLPERQLLAELGAYLADHLLTDLEPTSSGKLSDGGVSTLALGCSALEGLGVLRAAEHHTLWRRVVPPEGLRDHLLRHPDLTRAALDLTLQAYVDHAAGRRRSLPDTRAPFDLPQIHRRAGRALLRCGYLEETARGRVLWTEAIAPVMREALLWDAAGHCLAEIWGAQEEAEARLFLMGLPDWLRGRLRATVLDRGAIAGIELMRRHRAGAHWTEVPQASPGSLSDAGFRVRVYNTAVRLIREGRA